MASTSRTEYLLVDEVVIQPTTRKFNRATLPRFNANLKVKIVPRGALISLGDDADSFKVEKSSSNEIQSEILSISGGISREKIVALPDREYRILRAAPDDARRYEVYSSGRLEWACELKPGDNLLVDLSKVPASINRTGCANAVLRWCGNPKHEKLFQTLYFGVEILDEKFRGHGESDGSYGGRKLFTCEKNCGLFVSVDRLYPHEHLKCPDLPSKDPAKAREKESTATTYYTSLSSDQKRKSLTRNMKEMMDLAENYEQSMELEIQHLKDDLERASIKADQQIRNINAKARENSMLKEKLKEKEQEIIELEETHKQNLQEQLQQCEAHLQQQLQEQQDQQQQVEMQLQQELQVVRQQCTQLQQQLREAVDDKQQFQARIETAFAFIRGDPPTSQVGFSAIELWEVPREDVNVSNKILGTGGWGYVAEGTFRGQKVAIKCLHRGILSQFTTNHVRREISIMVQVRHPNLVLLIGAVLSADTGPLIITELLDRSLRSAYEDHLLEEGCKLPILRDVAAALNYLHTHRRPIIHRDVSSSNVLLLALRDGNWLAKLSDFGSANLIRTATTPAEGAVPYSAPEVTTEERVLQTPKVDVYSYGVLVCEISLCQLPPDPSNFPAYLASLQGNVDDRIHLLALNCIKRDPEERLTMHNILIQINELLQ